MKLVRLLAGVLFLIAALALAADVTRAVNGAPLTMTSLGTHWQTFAPQRLLKAKELVLSNAWSKPLWDSVIWRVLSLPTWFLLGALGLAFALLGRRQRRVNIFIN